MLAFGISTPLLSPLVKNASLIE
uniref:Uncharacterized protein n=1 Tax=Anguilla anguilla TaxID=7936 RepID=A0A0E9TEB9_ANGAN